MSFVVITSLLLSSIFSFVGMVTWYAFKTPFIPRGVFMEDYISPKIHFQHISGNTWQFISNQHIPIGTVLFFENSINLNTYNVFQNLEYLDYLYIYPSFRRLWKTFISRYAVIS